MRHTLQHSARRCNTLQHTATHCNTLQHTAPRCNTQNLFWTCRHRHAFMTAHINAALSPTHCNTLHYTALHCNTLQHTAPHCNTLQHAASYCNTLHHTATHCNTQNLFGTCQQFHPSMTAHINATFIFLYPLMQQSLFFFCMKWIFFLHEHNHIITRVFFFLNEHIHDFIYYNSILLWQHTSTLLSSFLYPLIQVFFFLNEHNHIISCITRVCFFFGMNTST